MNTMYARALITALCLAAAFTAGAQTAKKNVIEYSPITCIKEGELALMQMNIASEGELRAYFRRINTTDWCSVEGTNEGPLSRVVLPKFEEGEEIEYFFVVLDGRRVVARSPRIYRARVSRECEAPFARHVVRLDMACGQDAQGIPAMYGAGYALGEELIVTQPPFGSPDRPNPDVPVNQP
jgi:hypothetical protein